MKIVHVVPSLDEQHGGPSKSVRALCRALAELPHAVELLTTATDAPPAGATFTDGKLTVRAFRREFPQRMYFSAGLSAALRVESADIIHHHALWLRTLHYARSAALDHDAPMVVSPRGMMTPWAWNHHRRRKALCSQLVHPGALAAAAGWHATSAMESSDISGLGFTQPICVSPNGVEAPPAETIAAAREYWHEVLPETASRPTALFYGRFHQKKRVLELIDVWLERANPDWLLLIAGLPEQYSVSALEEYVRTMSGSHQIRVYGGAGRPAPYAIARIFLLPSHSENFGMTIAEAMAHRVPVLVTDTTPWNDLNVRKCGWCVPWDQYGSQLAAVTNMNRDALAAMGAVAKEWVLQEYSWHRSAALLAGFYETLL